MGEDESSSSQHLCEECGLNPSKYKCPGCSIRSCSLPCVKSHKQRTNCSGKKIRTDSIPLSQFDDNLLMTDYNFLEETKRIAESAQRLRSNLCGNSLFGLPMRWKKFRNAANRRKIRVLILPTGMSKRETNQSYFDQRKNSIFWTIEWRFYSTKIVLIDHRVDENVSLSNVVAKHLKPGPWNHGLKPFCNQQLDSLKFFIQKNPKGSKSRFRELNIHSSLSKQLSSVVIVEYPVIQVFLPSHSYDFEVDQEKNGFSNTNSHTEPACDISVPMGIPFKEEGIEEEDFSLGVPVLDLTDFSNPEPINNFQIPEGSLLHNGREKKESYLPNTMFSTVVNEKEALNISDFHLSEFRDDKTFIYLNSGLNYGDDVDFDFEQELKDDYSELIGQVNSNNSLCLDDVFIDERKSLDKTDDFIIFDGLHSVDDEELEEGEIPEF